MLQNWRDDDDNDDGGEGKGDQRKSNADPYQELKNRQIQAMRGGQLVSVR